MKKPRNQIARVGLVANCAKADSRAAIKRALSLIARAGRTAAMEIESARMAGAKCQSYPTVAELAAHCDLLMIFGGDGTFLRAVRDCAGTNAPILGINVGRLGFLTAVSSNDLPGALQKVWSNDFSMDKVSLLEATVISGGKKTTMHALNDIAISHGAVSRLIELEVSVDGEAVTRYRGDGLIVSSPAGSTAYSLSAGGPIVSPSAGVFAITPICPHTVSNRTVIVSMDTTVKVDVLSRQMEIIVAGDGQVEASVGAGDVITIRRTRRAVHLMRLGGWSFFDTVRRKLHWSGSAV